MSGCLSGANDANVSITFGVRHHQATVLLGDTDGNVAVFVSQMFLVEKRDQLWVGKDSTAKQQKLIAYLTQHAPRDRLPPNTVFRGWGGCERNTSLTK